MRIGLFTDDFLPRKSGIASSIMSLRLGLESLGHEVYIIAPSARGHHESDHNIIRLPSINPLIFDKSRLAVPLPRHIRPILDLRLDIIHSHTQFSMGVVADYVARKTGVPHITTAHTIWSEFAKYYPLQAASSFGFLSLLYQLYFFEQMKIASSLATGGKSVGLLAQSQIWNLKAIFYNSVDSVTVPSEHFADLLVRHGIQKPVVIPNGINLDFFKKPKTKSFDGNLRIVCVGRLSQEKRQDVLIKALVHSPRVRLSLIGDGPSIKELQNIAKRLGVADRVQFCGSRDHEFVRQSLLEADAFALASYKFDSQAIVLIEAQAAGLPVIICDPELMISTSPDSSILTGQKTADFAEAFQYLQKNPQNLENMSKAARKTANKFDRTTYAKQMLKEYEKLV